MKISFAPSVMGCEKLKAGTEALLEEMKQIPESLEVRVEFNENPQLTAKRVGNQVQITCKESAHYYRGLNQVLHHLDTDTYENQETVYFERNGFMLDCSRNAVFTVEKVKSVIRTLAKMGMNVLMLYTEDTYEVPGEPYFGSYRGRYTKAEIQEMDAYASMFGIELVPCIQTLAHLHNALKWPGKNEIKDSTDVLIVGKEETYTFIEKLLQSVKEAFSTRRVHLGMDEAVLLGLGKYLKENGYEKGSVLIREHCKRVLAICKKLGLEPMIWSDMYITANTNGGYYEVPADADCSSWEKPEKGLGLVYWDYYHDDEKSYEKMLNIHKQLSDDVIFAGGSWIWNGIAPNYSKTFACTKAALQTCKKYLMKEVLCTAWMDNGAETPVDAVWPGVALFAHLGFHLEYNEKVLEEEFKECVGGNLKDFMALDAFDSLFLNGKANQEAQNPSKYLLYQDPMAGTFDQEVVKSGVDTGAYYEKLKKMMEICQENSPEYAALFAYYEKLAAVLADKADLGVRIKTSYDKNQKLALKEICEKEIPETIQNLEEMKVLREDLWMSEAKPFGYELMDVKLGAVITRLNSTIRRIKKYLDGSIPCLEELEETRLPYFEKNADKRENRWSQIISGSDLIDTI
nr:beta-N-acetylhexosaminidase [uncultured Blautia sp.]